MKLVMAKEGYKKVGDKYLLARKCSKCGKWLVASTDNFSRQKGGKYGLHSQCKKCRNKKNKQWREDSPEYYKQYRKKNKERLAEYHKRYYETNNEKIKQYREANRDKRNEQQKQWYKNNKDRRAKYYKQYKQTLQGQVAYFNSHQRRRTKEEQQGTGITQEQWLEMMSFFGWKCAYSGEYIGGSNNSFNRTIDHIVPLDAEGDHMIWNCVPMTRSLNSSKQAKDMLEWYREQSFYDPSRLQKIYEWQEYAYNKWGKDTQYFNSGNIQIKLI